MPLPPSEFKCNCSPRTMTVFRPGTLVSETFTVTGNQITARNILGLWGPYSSSWEMSSTRDLHGALGQGRSRRVSFLCLGSWESQEDLPRFSVFKALIAEAILVSHPLIQGVLGTDDFVWKLLFWCHLTLFPYTNLLLHRNQNLWLPGTWAPGQIVPLVPPPTRL